MQSSHAAVKLAKLDFILLTGIRLSLSNEAMWPYAAKLTHISRNVIYLTEIGLRSNIRTIHCYHADRSAAKGAGSG